MFYPARIAAALATVPAAALMLGACSGTPHALSSAHASALASAKASARASAHAVASARAPGPALRPDATRFLAPCVRSATHGELTIGVTTTGQAAIPGTTTPPVISVTHWDVRVLFRPFHKFDSALHCSLPAGTYPAAKHCAEKLNLPTSKTEITGYIAGLAGCAVGAPQ
jgi:hypothetical protein